MTEQEYADIAAACDRLLRAPRTNLARLAIRILHFANEHPASLGQYAPLLTQSSDVRLTDIPRAVMHASRALTRSLSVARRAPAHPGPADVLIVSHLLKQEQLSQETDFYFGALQRQLKERGATSLLLLINHLSPGVQPPPPSAYPRVILPARLPLATEANIWQQCASAWRALRREAATSRNSMDSRLAMLASRQALSVSTANNLRMHASVANTCRAINPKIVITTYEGSVAERLIWHAARAARRQPLCVGYQHALLLERSHSIRRPVAARGLDCDPQVILTLGEIPHAHLAASPELQSVRLIEYGSHRRSPLPPLPDPQHRPRCCLVLPDANDAECATLFDFALLCARRRSDIDFVLRPHPMVDTRSLLRRRRVLQELPANVSVSADKPLEQEFARARYCLYRGSSAALHAVRAGIKPYYLALSGELPFDCLFTLADWRETVTSPEDLLNRISLCDSSAGSEAAHHAASLCERHISAVRPAAIDELLAMAPP